MNAAEALADLTEISSQVEAAVLSDDASGAVLAATFSPERANEFVRAARDLVERAERVRAGEGGSAVTHLRAVTREGSVFVVREGGLLLAATTGPSPTVGLVLYDLKTCLRALADDSEGVDAAA